MSPFRRYVPFGSALLAKWLGRFACFAVLSIQWIPLLGIGSLPIMAAVNYAIYRRAFQAGLAKPEGKRLPIVGFHRLAKHSYEPLGVGNVRELLADYFIGRAEAFLANQENVSPRGTFFDPRA